MQAIISEFTVPQIRSCDQKLHFKLIHGRLNLFIKRKQKLLRKLKKTTYITFWKYLFTYERYGLTGWVVSFGGHLWSCEFHTPARCVQLQSQTTRISILRSVVLSWVVQFPPPKQTWQPKMLKKAIKYQQTNKPIVYVCESCFNLCFFYICCEGRRCMQ